METFGRVPEKGCGGPLGAKARAVWKFVERDLRYNQLIYPAALKLQTSSH